MKIKFEYQQYQQDAVDAVTSLFEGQPVDSNEFHGGIRLNLETSRVVKEQENFLAEGVVSNNLYIDNETIKRNLFSVQDLSDLENHFDFKNGIWNFSVEMETGTGKTYVYIKTIFELNRKYGFKKFIIVVPSVAIREGVLKTFEITQEHFKALYNNQIFHYFVYNSKRAPYLKAYARNNTIQIMIINKDAFSKDSNIINKEENEKGNDVAFIKYVQATNPIVIIDEPQSLGESGEAAVANLNPLFCLRYSATHRNYFNQIYKLDPIKAYQLRLVKRIELASTQSIEGHNSAYVKLCSVENKNGKFSAKVEVNVRGVKGAQRKKITVKYKDDLFVKSEDREEYRHNFIISEINSEPGRERIKFSSGKTLKLGEETGGFDKDIKRVQIKNTIREHLEKFRILKPKGIKVLSLFFIDRVANYRYYDEQGNAQKGQYATWFEESFNELIQEEDYRGLINEPVEKIHNGYFSQDKQGKMKDSKGEGSAKDDEDTYSLIMKEKERLLSLSEPLQFIFSHSALREGWDNPNVFQICTLNENTASEIKKRQEIGRGLRLPVRLEGSSFIRIQDENINKLTVVTNESYKDFVAQLQNEMAEDGIEFGVIRKNAFSSICEVYDGKEKFLGKAESEVIWERLKAKGHLNEEGKVQNSFDPKAPNFNLGLGDDYTVSVQRQIIDVIEGKRLINHVADARLRKNLKLNKQVFAENEDFKILWNKISQKTRYSVNYSSAVLITNAAKAIKESGSIEAPRIVVRKDRLNLKEQGIDTEQAWITEEEVPFIGQLPDIVGYIQRETELTRGSIIKILLQSERLEDFKVNPSRFMEMVTEIIKDQLHSLMIDGIKYEKIEGEFWDMTLFQREGEEELTRYLTNLLEIQNKNKTLYDYIEFGSDVEKEFAKKMDERDDIKLFIKLPRWFKIETPIGFYEPDWAIVKKLQGKEDKLYFVRETKSSLEENKRRSYENDKIKCGEAHFDAISVDYAVVTSADQV